MRSIDCTVTPFRTLSNACRILPAVLLLATVLLAAGPGHTATVGLTGLDQAVNIAPFTDILPDPGRNITPEQAASPVTGLRFRDLQGQLSEPVTGPAWLRFSLEKRDGAELPPMVLDLGRRLPSPVTIYLLGRQGEVREVGRIDRPQPLQTASIDIPALGMEPATFLLQAHPLPSLLTAPILRPANREATIPLELFLPGILAAAALLLILRAARERAQWRVWAALYALSALVQSVFPAGPLPPGVLASGDIAALLSAGFLIMLLPHAGRHLLNSKKNAPGADWLLVLSPVLGAILILLPLVPDMTWTSQYLELWPVLLLPAFLAAFICLVRGVAGSLAFLIATLSPLLGMAASVFEILGGGSPILGMTGPLWGAAFGSLAFALAPSPAREDAGQEQEPDVTDQLDDLLYKNESAGLTLAGDDPEPNREASAGYAPAAQDRLATDGPSDSVSTPWLASSTSTEEEGAGGEKPTSTLGDGLPSDWGAGLFPSAADAGPPSDTGLAGKSDPQTEGSVKEPAQAAAAPEAGPEERPMPAAEQIPAQASSASTEALSSALADEFTDLADPVYPSVWNSSVFSPVEEEARTPEPESDASSTPVAAESEPAASTDIPSLIPSVWESSFSGEPSPTFPPVAEGGASGPSTTPVSAASADSIEPDAAGNSGIRPGDIPAKPVSIAEDETQSLAESLADEPAPDLAELAVFDLTGLLSATHSEVARLAEAKGLGLSWHVSPHLQRHYLGHGENLSEALNNVLISAVSAVEKGSVELSVRRAPGDPDPGHLVFAVGIQGGASSGQLDMVSMGRAWNLANATGGFFSLDHSQEGLTGLVFSARFTCTDLTTEILEQDELEPAPPMIQPEPAELVDAPGGQPEPWVKERIILVDMAAGNRRMRANYLASLPHAVLEAESVEDAVNEYSRHPSGLVILDGDLPEADIIGFLARLREMERSHSFPATATLILTGHDLQANRMLDAGCSEVLKKPFSREDLQACVQRLAPTKQDLAPGLSASLTESERMAINLHTPYSEPMFFPSGNEPEAEALETNAPCPVPGDNGMEAEAASAPPELAAPETGDEKTGHPDSRSESPQDRGEPQTSGPLPDADPAEGLASPDAHREPDEQPASSAPVSAADESLPALEPENSLAGEPATDRAATAGDSLPDADSHTASARGGQRGSHSPGSEHTHADQNDDDPLSASDAPALGLLDMIITDDESVCADEDGPRSDAKPSPERARPAATRPAKATATASVTPAPKPKNGKPRAAATVSIQTHRPSDAPSVAEEEKPVVRVSLREEEPLARVPLPEVNDSINGDMLPFVPGLSYELADAIRDALKGLEENSCLVVQEAAERLAGKANAFGLAGLERVARCVERAAAADDAAAVADLLQELATLTERYRESILNCHKTMYSV